MLERKSYHQQSEKKDEKEKTETEKKRPENETEKRKVSMEEIVQKQEEEGKTTFKTGAKPPCGDVCNSR